MKTIEKVALEYAAKLNYSLEAKHNMCPRDFEITFKDGANYIMSLPLAYRLTAEEKAKIKAEYADAYPQDPDRSIASLRVAQALESIFGKEMFAESDTEQLDTNLSQSPTVKCINGLEMIASRLMEAHDAENWQEIAHISLDIIPRLINKLK